MADHGEDLDKKEKTLMEKISEKIRGKGDDSSSLFDSESEKKTKVKSSSPPSSVKSPLPPSSVKSPSLSSSVKNKIFRLFSREKPVDQVFGRGKLADVFLWRNKKISVAILGGVTALWVLFELLEYHLLTLVCHSLILVLVILFLWSNATTFINKSPPWIPEVRLPEEPFLQTAAVLRLEIASGRDLKKFLAVISRLWFFSILGSCCNFITLFYITFVLLHTLPVLYEKYEDKVDLFAEKAMIEIRKQYADAKVFNKIPRGTLKDKKRA